jgi:hypothetical protein
VHIAAEQIREPPQRGHPQRHVLDAGFAADDGNDDEIKQG